MQHKCFKCGTEFDGNFCPECGEKWQETKTCPKCGATLAGNAKFCNECGYSFISKAPPQKPAATMTPTPAATPTPKPAFHASIDREKAKLYAVCLYLPYVLIALFSVLFFFFYLAPVAVMPGGELFGETIPSESYGNIYQMTSGETFPALAGSSIACIVFAAFLLADALFCLYVAVIRHDTRGAKPLAILGHGLIAALLIIGCVMMGIVGKEDGGMGMISVGAAPILIVVFSSLEIVLSIAAECVKRSIARNYPEAVKAYDERIALRERDGEERLQQYRETTPAPIEPNYIGKPVKPIIQKPIKPIYRSTTPKETQDELKQEMEKHIKRKRILVGAMILFLAVCGIICFSFGHVWVGPLLYIGPFVVIALCIIIAGAKTHIQQWHPEKVYRYKGLLASIFIIHLPPLIMCLVVTLPSLSAGDLDFGSILTEDPPILLMLLPAMGIILLSFFVALLLYHKTAKQRKALCVKLCGAESIKKSALSRKYEKELEAYKTEKREKFDEYKQQLEIYRVNSKKWTVYRYQMARYQKGKSYENASYSRAWLYVHRIAVSVTAVALAAVITVTCVVATRDRRFRAESLVKIGLGADEARVTEVLGEPSEKTSTTWYYYSKNFVSLQEDFAALEEKMMDAESMEELEKLYNESEKLDEKMKTIEYQWISVEFSIDNKVYEMALDTTAVYGKKQEKAVESIVVLQEGASQENFYSYRTDAPLTYAIMYQDGSYWTGYFSDAQLPTKSGVQTIQWSNEWGSYSVTITVAK